MSAAVPKRRVLIFALAALLMSSGRLAAGEPADDGGLAELMAAVGQERTLGMDYFSDIIPSTSDCIGDTSTPLCFVDTFMACLGWMDRPDICAAVGADDLGYNSGPWRYDRFRYQVSLVDVLDETRKLPWTPPLNPSIAPASQYVCFSDGSLSPQPGDVALVFLRKQCKPGGAECVAQMSKPLDVEHDICIRDEPCYGDRLRVGLVVRHTVDEYATADWQLVEAWWILDELVFDLSSRYHQCE